MMGGMPSDGPIMGEGGDLPDARNPQRPLHVGIRHEHRLQELLEAPDPGREERGVVPPLADVEAQLHHRRRASRVAGGVVGAGRLRRRLVSISAPSWAQQAEERSGAGRAVCRERSTMPSAELQRKRRPEPVGMDHDDHAALVRRD
jgi:hypothetical protein